jgi:hypothetical protein
MKPSKRPFRYSGGPLQFPPAPSGPIPYPEELRRADLARAEAAYPFPLLEISRRRALLWVCKVPGHNPCTCWPEGYPTIEDAIQDLTLEQLGVKR